VTGQLRIRPEASADIAEAFSWYEAQRAGLGGDLVVELDRTFEAMRLYPAAGPIVYRGLRRVLVPRFPYSVYYRVEAEIIEVRGVLHNRRSPATRDRRVEPFK
jgi:toxin ParE1/3/4